VDLAQGIRVNAVAPGFFASEMSGSYPPGHLDRFIGLIPAARPVRLPRSLPSSSFSPRTPRATSPVSRCPSTMA
jgi:NAD(P)-dependent dehydrogenase (short-subunit alcohol dehydrogenase family)